tara:strand:- start:934 stop:1188 length:255 start_codon:yes stop_codon:yes gene_type:complete
MKILRLVLLASMLMCFHTLAFAQEPKIQYKKKTEIDFDDVTVEGALKRPHGAYLLDKRGSSFNPLIKLKENWDQEMIESVNQVR